MKLLKRILIGFFIVIASAFAILSIIANNTHPETLKNLFNNQLTAITGKKSTINGSLSWQIFPTPGIKITDITLGSGQNNQDYCVSVNKLLLSLKIAPLLGGKLVFSDLTLDGVQIDINTDAIKTASQLQKLKLQPENEKKEALQFQIDRFLLTHGQVTIKGQDKTLLLKNLRLGIEQFNLRDNPFSIQLKTQLLSNISDKSLKAQLSYNGHMSIPSVLLQNSDHIDQKLNTDGQIQLKNVQIDAFQIDDIHANIRTLPKKMNLSPLTLSLYGGESVGDMYYDYAKNTFYLNQTATNLDGKSLMKALINHDRIQGNLDYSIQAEIPLNHFNLENVTGKGNLTLKDGSLNKMNVPLLIQDMNSIVTSVLDNHNSKTTKTVAPNQFDSQKYRQQGTPFKLISIQYLLSHAQLLSESIILQTDAFQIKGEGNLNLTNQNIQSRLSVTVSSDSEATPLQSIQKILGGSYPILLEGTLENPSIHPDLPGLNSVLNNISVKKTAQKSANRSTEVNA